MDIGNKIRAYREVRGLSQEELASKIYVSRQTISNWETGKQYPDIQNVLLLSVLFGVSVDELIKGDLEAMKAKLSDKKVNTAMSAYTWVMLIAAVLGTMSIGLVIYFEQSTLIILVPIICFAVMFISASQVERIKKRKNLRTYAEIVAFTDGQDVEEQRQKRDPAKNRLEKLMIVGGFAVVVCMIALVSVFIFVIFK
ncbi:helix-turn-helix domain-containing protein [Lentilactobacillus buchneri]|uniref:Transcriptional regulator, Cro/CI family n=1 Tax=Lentilactobacillus buchneri subsp. silagei CD034 TaxID=1071400 RepID=J9W2I1_LENBU|nr:helix-turn-helix transcriptional regulator [Lentilactobacillus buchneri]MCC6101245.1 helix-turn-helix domain-containing protein [Lactobacillus sp.]AFS00708.1 transcriptional regulator, Cro/CI family [Lentilactobacillus buchneri subsp. silagei CD034]MCT2902023.1 XRE family transcriptional regulator [Lentilactobacillus buchneri]MCT3543042.1 XRE family transcriptional regulator [Lentilactobacillus buchneri]MCT3544308.1 XRE family transcriptional regulator [Lentilactobacillus buchneri]